MKLRIRTIRFERHDSDSLQSQIDYAPKLSRCRGHGRPLVILHGFLGSSDNWRSMSKRLSSHFTRLLSQICSNHGQSPHSDAMDYPIMAADLREFVEEQSLAQVFLLGHSMGGKVAMQFAGQYPERVDKLVVSSTSRPKPIRRRTNPCSRRCARLIYAPRKIFPTSTRP